MARTSTSSRSEAVKASPDGPAAEKHSPARGAKAVPAKKSVVTSARAKGAEKPAAARPGRAAGSEKAPLRAAATAKPPARTEARSPAPERGYGGDEEFLALQREALLADRATYLEQAQALRAEAESLVTEAEPGDVQFDEESGEGGTMTVDRERDLALSAQALAAVEEITAALEKIEQGRYGICEGCGELIAKPRLEALPYARLCIACKSGGLSRR